MIAGRTVAAERARERAGEGAAAEPAGGEEPSN
jgi:hypothetical protein